MSQNQNFVVDKVLIPCIKGQAYVKHCQVYVPLCSLAAKKQNKASTCIKLLTVQQIRLQGCGCYPLGSDGFSCPLGLSPSLFALNSFTFFFFAFFRSFSSHHIMCPPDCSPFPVFCPAMFSPSVLQGYPKGISCLLPIASYCPSRLC